MTFNNLINHLKRWCINKATVYRKAYGEYGGVSYVGYLVVYELEWKLSTLIDKPFNSVDDLQAEILRLIDIHFDPSILKPENNVAKQIIRKINKEFCEFIEDVLPRMDNLTLVDIPYNRVIIGSEATILQDKFRSVWGYENTSYWFPLMGDKPTKISEKFYIMFDYVEPYMKEIEQIIGLPQTHLYSCGESIFGLPNCLETVELIEYGGLETIYTDLDFSWAIYFSHENTVTFAGSIVPKIKDLLSNEKQHWDKFQ